MDSALFEHHKTKFIIFGSCLVLGIILLATIPLALINSSNPDAKVENSYNSAVVLSHSTTHGEVSEPSASLASGSSLPSNPVVPSSKLGNVLYSTKVRVIIIVSVLAVVIIAASLVTAYILHKRAVDAENQRRLKELEEVNNGDSSPPPRSYIRRAKEKAIIFFPCMLLSVFFMYLMRKCVSKNPSILLLCSPYVLLLIFGGCFYGVPGALTSPALLFLGFCLTGVVTGDVEGSPRAFLGVSFASILFIIVMMFTPSNAFVPFFEGLLDKLAVAIRF